MFGAMTLESADRRQTKFPTKRSALILARLAIEPEQRLGRDELAGFLWPDDFLDITRVRLRQEIRRLKQALEPLGDYIRADRQWVEIEPGRLTTDISAFDAAIRGSLAAQDTDEKAAALTRAVQLVNGSFLAGFQEPWVLAMRRTYEEKARRAWLDLADAHQALGAEEAALNATIQAVRHDPLDTDANVNLIRRLVERGQIARARQVFRDFDAMMFREFGRHAPASVRGILGITTTTESAPEAPAGETLVRNAVPRPRTLFGRDELLESIRAYLARPGSTAVLVGPVRVGKSHLLREAAWQFSRDHELPVQFGGTPDRVSDGLFVIDPASAPNAQTDLRGLVATAASQGWRVLAESRVRLDEDGLHEFLVNPLPVPRIAETEEAIYANASVRLLRSQASESAELIGRGSEAAKLAELARQLGGIPGLLRDFSSRLTVRSADELVESIEEDLVQYVQDPGLTGESLVMAVEALQDALPAAAKDAFHSLAVLNGASVDLAGRLAASAGSPDAWRMLERRGLVTIQGQGRNRRFRIPNPIAVAARAGSSEEDYRRIVAETWRVVGDWLYEQSRQMVGPSQDLAFDRAESELANIMQALTWATDNDPRLAGLLVAGVWRTVGARGNPSVQAKLLWRGARAGASLLPSEIGGESCLGAAMALSIAGFADLAESAYADSMRIFNDGQNQDKYAWACMNYAADILLTTDLPRAIKMLKEAAEQTSEEGDRHLALAHYSEALAMTGDVEGSIRVAEGVFARQQQSTDPAARGRAYVDLANCYRSVGRHEAARPLLVEGAHRLREAGIQDYLFENLVLLAELNVEAGRLDQDRLEVMVEEAAGIANRLGSNAKLLKVARLRMAWRAAQGDADAFIIAVDDVFRFTQGVRAPAEREKSLRQLADCLEKFGKTLYASAIHAALGDEVAEGGHPGWQALLSSDSHATVCVLAVVMAKESLAA